MPERLKGYSFEIAEKIVSPASTTVKFCQLFLQGVKAGGKVDKDDGDGLGVDILFLAMS
jgi:hypothetical protein